MRKIFLFFFLLFTIHYSLFTIHHPAYADELDDIGSQINELEKARQMSINATKPLESELSRLDQKLSAIQDSLKKAEENLLALEKSISIREKEFTRQYVILAQRVESYYKNLRQPAKFLTLLSSKTASALTKNIAYRQVAAQEDKRIISSISSELLDLEKDKQKVEENKLILAQLKVKTDDQAGFFRKEVKGAKDYQAQLSTKIAELSQKQQQLIAQKLGSLNLPTSLGAGPLFCTDDRTLDPGFSPAFAFFTFGIPHRVGMNQYGAYGRAKIGQNYQQILASYFNNINFDKKDPNMRIKVQGYGEMGLDEYMLGIYEMPGDWPIEALKAQVVAARSYALAYTNNGAGEICTTQACQVYKGGNKGGGWEQAVRETSGEVMVSNGEVIKAWYSSTDGGYTFTSGDAWGGSAKSWTKRLRDTSGEISSFSDLFNLAFDRDSPCFYAAQGWRTEYGKSAWIKSEEAADIVNVLILAKTDSSTQKHLAQIDRPNPDGEETWDSNRVKSELRGRGIGAFNAINSISIDWDKSMGQTTSVTVNGDGGSRSFSGGEFKDYFNLRAPANIQIVGLLFNVERK